MAEAMRVSRANRLRPHAIDSSHVLRRPIGKSIRALRMGEKAIQQCSGGLAAPALTLAPRRGCTDPTKSHSGAGPSARSWPTRTICRKTAGDGQAVRSEAQGQGPLHRIAPRLLLPSRSLQPSAVPSKNILAASVISSYGGGAFLTERRRLWLRTWRRKRRGRVGRGKCHTGRFVARYRKDWS